jgi:hypothetical protein
LGTAVPALWGALSGGLLSLDVVAVGAFGAVPLVLSGISLRSARRLRHQIEAGNREQFVIELARRRGGLLKAADVSQAVELPREEAQKLLEDLVRQGRADIDVSASGETVFSFDERRLLGP